MLLVDGGGGPLGAIVAPANAHDSTLIGGVIEAVVVDRPDPKTVPQNLCLDKGFDTPNARAAVAQAKYVPHIRSIGEEAKPCDRAKGHKPRRWVVERTIAWLNKCRAILVRYDKNAENYLGLTQLGCALLWWRRLCKLCGDPVSG
jgi:putative transposase